MKPMTKYVRVTFVRHEEHEVIAKVEADLSGRELEDVVEVPFEWMERYFGQQEAGLWEIEDVTEISQEEALRCQREVDIDTFVTEPDEQPQ